MFNELYIAFWNVENLFDVETADRPERVRKIIAKDIIGWNVTLLEAKLSQLSKVIRSINNNDGPDILGVCEVENRDVLEKLAAKIFSDNGRKYSVAHADAGDNRGIDVAFLYDENIVKVALDNDNKEEIFQHWVVKRYATRELFQVNFVINEKKLALIGNHWPSRSGGQYESEPYRITAGETLAYWVDRVHEELGRDAAVVAMGDFNDEPFNRSLTEYALSTNNKNTAKRVTKNYLLNLMWPLLAKGVGSHYFGSKWNMLDQILVSRGIANGKSGWKVKGDASIEGTNVMSKRGKPWRFGIRLNQRDMKGFSDHFPVSVKLEWKGVGS